ncbi:hypothetical protein GCM10010182_06590 [Actinomadura cremea]|nr:hypothetical protein GCM10010182_06590 [Actinomadura cremea]
MTGSADTPMPFPPSPYEDESGLTAKGVADLTGDAEALRNVLLDLEGPTTGSRAARTPGTCPTGSTSPADWTATGCSRSPNGRTSSRSDRLR